jgi:thioredoxin 1
MAVEITDSNFDELVMNSTQPVVVDFWAEWCGPCRLIGPVIEELSKEYEGRAIVGKVDVDANSEDEARRIAKELDMSGLSVWESWAIEN